MLKKTSKLFEKWADKLKANPTEAQIVKVLVATLKDLEKIEKEAVSTQLYADSKEQIELFEKEVSTSSPEIEKRIVGVFNHLAMKVLRAPTSLHRKGVVVLIIPVLTKLIKEYVQIKSDAKSK